MVITIIPENHKLLLEGKRSKISNILSTESKQTNKGLLNERTQLSTICRSQLKLRLAFLAALKRLFSPREAPAPKVKPLFCY